MSDFSLNRIRILKTGLARVERYIDMTVPENILFFEKLAQPGTQLKLKRVKDRPEDPFRIEVFSEDDRFLGRVTVGKNETAARLMDAGFSVVAIVNESMPVHDSDLPKKMLDSVGTESIGWDEKSRTAVRYEDCNLPYSLYLEDR